ncbi:MAG: hypothetical protein R2716_11175 [Microthrixaceae bacterium]
MAVRDEASDLLEQLDSALPGAAPAARPGPVPGGSSGPRPAGAADFEVHRLASLRNRLLASLVGDRRRGAELLALWRPSWNGRPVELDRIPSSWGTVSVALRWHGERAALLWEIRPWAGAVGPEAAPVVSAPGMDADWLGSGWSGEALLDPHG